MQFALQWSIYLFLGLLLNVWVFTTVQMNEPTAIRLRPGYLHWLSVSSRCNGYQVRVSPAIIRLRELVTLVTLLCPRRPCLCYTGMVHVLFQRLHSMIKVLWSRCNAFWFKYPRWGSPHGLALGFLYLTPLFICAYNVLQCGGELQFDIAMYVNVYALIYR